MKSFLLFLLFLLFCLGGAINCLAQNLVRNGSFEEYSSCPWSTGQADTCINWYGFGGADNLPQFPGTPDYFVSCAPPVVKVPDNYFGTQAAFEGNAYMGLYTTDYVWWYREFIGTQLIETLIPGNRYNVSMRVSRGNWTIYQTDNCVASNKLGVRFTTSSYSQTNLPLVNNYAQLYEDSIITDTLNWVLLRWNFIPDSAYRYIYIGNFFDDAHTDTTRIGCPIPPGHAYYFIDSVNVICTDKNCGTGTGILMHKEFSLEYDENLQMMLLHSSEKAVLVLFNLVGQQIMNDNFFGTKQLTVSQLCKGIYIAWLRTEQKTIIKKITVY